MTGTFNRYDSWKSRDEDGIRVVRANVVDRPTVADLLAWLNREAPGTPLDEIHISGGHIGWDRDATPDEFRERVEWHQAAAARQEEWERAALVRFLAKYGMPDEVSP